METVRQVKNFVKLNPAVRLTYAVTGILMSMAIGFMVYGHAASPFDPSEFSFMWIIGVFLGALLGTSLFVSLAAVVSTAIGSVVVDIVRLTKKLREQRSA